MAIFVFLILLTLATLMANIVDSIPHLWEWGFALPAWVWWFGLITAFACLGGR
jgi:hypothetical protein